MPYATIKYELVTRDSEMMEKVVESEEEEEDFIEELMTQADEDPNIMGYQYWIEYG